MGVQCVDMGLLGDKTNQGFYSYPDPAYAGPEVPLGERTGQKIEFQ